MKPNPKFGGSKYGVNGIELNVVFNHVRFPWTKSFIGEMK